MAAGTSVTITAAADRPAENEGLAFAEAIPQLIRVLMDILEDVFISISSGKETTAALTSAIQNLIAVRKLTLTVE